MINIQTVCLCLFLAEPGSAMLEHFNHLRRQWASKAQKLLHSLKKITTVDIEPVLGNVCTCSHKVKERKSFIVLLSIARPTCMQAQLSLIDVQLIHLSQILLYSLLPPLTSITNQWGIFQLLLQLLYIHLSRSKQ